jgi:hypothetical protein
MVDDADRRFRAVRLRTGYAVPRQALVDQRDGLVESVEREVLLTGDPPNHVVCEKWIADLCGAPVVEVEQPAKPFAVLDRHSHGDRRASDGSTNSV